MRWVNLNGVFRIISNSPILTIQEKVQLLEISLSHDEIYKANIDICKIHNNLPTPYKLC